MRGRCHSGYFLNSFKVSSNKLLPLTKQTQLPQYFQSIKQSNLSLDRVISIYPNFNKMHQFYTENLSLQVIIFETKYSFLKTCIKLKKFNVKRKLSVRENF